MVIKKIMSMLPMDLVGRQAINSLQMAIKHQGEHMLQMAIYNKPMGTYAAYGNNHKRNEFFKR